MTPISHRVIFVCCFYLRLAQKRLSKHSTITGRVSLYIYLHLDINKKVSPTCTVIEFVIQFCKTKVQSIGLFHIAVCSTHGESIGLWVVAVSWGLTATTYRFNVPVWGWWFGECAVVGQGSYWSVLPGSVDVVTWEKHWGECHLWSGALVFCSSWLKT